MGMGIDQAGHDKPAFGVQPCSPRISGGQVGCRAGLDNGVPEDGNAAIFDNGFVPVLKIDIPAGDQKISSILRRAHCISENAINGNGLFSI
jgi:hypothetical protein